MVGFSRQVSQPRELVPKALVEVDHDLEGRKGAEVHVHGGTD